MNDQIIVQLGDLDSSDPMEDRPSLSNVVTESYDPNAFESIVVYLSSGDDRLLVDLDTEHPITAYGGQDDDVMISQGSAVVFYGEQGADTLQGSHRNDLLDAGEGADHAIGGGGNDQIRIDSLEDRADGGDQYDQLIWVGPAIPF
ncbi:MAG: calcium-binding protein, partial [Rubripirellula sp.]